MDVERVHRWLSEESYRTREAHARGARGAMAGSRVHLIMEPAPFTPRIPSQREGGGESRLAPATGSHPCCDDRDNRAGAGSDLDGCDYSCDLSTREGPADLIRTVVAEQGRIDALILSHAHDIESGILDTTADSFDRHVAVKRSSVPLAHRGTSDAIRIRAFVRKRHRCERCLHRHDG
ncbi:hypothetical protein [Microbacterium hominis]|uniref:hypothetical protein n=1 Tax=Microbacterium hominis TaxID=162426 RepID=UPI0020B84A86|nr:hypothetical protein [Microbacterium hominis]